MRVSRLSKSALQFRNGGVVHGEIARKCVALIGLGALGSQVAELLAKAGIGRFRLCDIGRLETGNAVRHVGGVKQFGALKADCVAERLLEINPYLEFSREDIWTRSATERPSDLVKFLEPADLVICTTADESTEAVVNEYAVLHKKPVLYGRSVHEGAIGRVFLVRPGTDACKGCLAGYVATKRSGGAVPESVIDIPEDTTKPLRRECGRPIIAGSGIDLGFTGTLVARIALDFLEETAGIENHWIWVGRRKPELDERLSVGLSTVAATVPPDPECPVCQPPPIREVVLPADIRAHMEAEVCSSPDRETGGILIGYVDGVRAYVTRATGPGPNAERSAQIFRRDVDYVQRELDKATDELGDRGLYIGEWHSHLTPNTTPSPTDVRSLTGIAHAPHYQTRCPVMVIAGLDPTAGTVKQMDAFAFPIGGRYHRIDFWPD